MISKIPFSLKRYLLCLGTLCLAGCIRRKGSIKNQAPLEILEAQQQTVHTTETPREEIAPLEPKAQGEKKVISAPPKTALDVPAKPPRTASKKGEDASGAGENKKAPASKKDADAKKSQTDETLIRVNFINEDLASLINHFAALQKRNVILPQGADALVQKISFHLPYEISLKDVDQYLDMFLDLSGYSRVPHGDQMYRIVKNDASVNKEALPLYVNVPPSDLPQSDERIRVIHYLKNLKVPDSMQGPDPLSMLFTEMLSPSRLIQADPKANALIIADKAANIKASLSIIAELDNIGTKDVLRSVPLYNSNAEVIEQLLKKQILAVGPDEQPLYLGAGPRTDAGKYFASGINVVADPRTNSLIVMGREPALERLQEFIREYLDVPESSGGSILHFYDLQYLDAEKFAPILQKVVSEHGLTSGSGQANQQSGTGPYRTFDGVIVEAEKVIAEKIEEKKLAMPITGSTTSKPLSQYVTNAAILTGNVYRGGNRLIITAVADDWKRLERLIKELDRPRLQIIVQVMILDFSATDAQILGAQTRNPSWFMLPPGVSFQSAQLTPPILDGPLNPNPPPTFSDPTTMAADLLRLLAGNVSAAASLISSNVGGTILSFNDTSGTTPGIWSFIQWLNQFGTTNVLSHPYMIVLNHSKGEELLSSIQRRPDVAQTGEGGAIAQKIVDVEAALRVSVVPRASSPNRVNLQISVVISQFIGTAGNRITREMHTNVNLSNGETLVIGGLAEDQLSEGESETPILGKIPILRWLFSNKTKALVRTNLAVFISPTIVEPRIRHGMDRFTKDETYRTYQLMKHNEFLGSLKEPVNYLFFNDEQDDLADMLDIYLAESKGDFVYKPELEYESVSNHHCAPCTTQAEADELKKMLASEKAPIILEKPPVEPVNPEPKLKEPRKIDK